MYNFEKLSLAATKMTFFFTHKKKNWSIQIGISIKIYPENKCHFTLPCYEGKKNKGLSHELRTHMHKLVCGLTFGLFFSCQEKNEKKKKKIAMKRQKKKKEKEKKSGPKTIKKKLCIALFRKSSLCTPQP